MEVVLRSVGAIWLCAAGGFVGYAVTVLSLRNEPRWVRLAGLVVATLSLASVAFHLLASVGWFALPAALATSILAVAVAWRITRGGVRLRVAARRDMRWFSMVSRLVARSPRRGMVCGFAVFAAMLLARSLVVPPLGFDTLMYHGVKSAMWAQRGEFIVMQGPGSWATYRLYPGVSEMLVAWSMLPFRGDALACFVDALHWLGVGLGAMALARQLRVREPFASLSALVVMSVPTFRLLVGSGYVETVMCECLLLGLFFAARFLVRPRLSYLVFAELAMGLAAGAKLPMVPLFLFVSGVLGLRSLFVKEPVSRRWVSCGAIVLAAFATVGPWWIHNAIVTGYPLSPLDLKLGPLVFGRANPELALFTHAPHPEALTKEAELGVLKTIFSPPGTLNESLGAFAALPLLVLPFGLISLARRRLVLSLTLAALAALIAVSFYSRDFAVIRHGWTVSSSRFLLPLVAIATPVSVAWCRRGVLSSFYRAALTTSALFGLIFYAVMWWIPYDVTSVLWFVLVAALLVAAGRAVWGRLPHSWLRSGLVVAFSVTFLVVVCRYKASTRYEAIRDCTVLHPTAKYWLDVATALDVPDRSFKLAVTSAPMLPMWLTYYFFGSRLQNEVVYVSSMRDGSIPPFIPDGEWIKQTDERSWRRRLIKEGITHVVTFGPPPLELEWITHNPRMFHPIAGQLPEWGVFEITREKEDSLLH